MLYVFKLKDNKTIVIHKNISSRFIVSVVGQIFKKKGYEGVNLNFKEFFSVLQTGPSISFNKSLKRLLLYRLGL
jgi:hypothetical protein